MPFSTFPLPADEAQIAEVRDRVNVQQDAVQALVGGVADSLIGNLVEQEAGIGAVQSKVLTSLRGKIGNQTRNLNPVVSHLANTLGSRIAETGSQLSLGTGRIITPPPFHPPPAAPGEWFVFWYFNAVQEKCLMVQIGNALSPYAINYAAGPFVSEADAQAYANAHQPPGCIPGTTPTPPPTTPPPEPPPETPPVCEPCPPCETPPEQPPEQPPQPQPVPCTTTCTLPAFLQGSFPYPGTEEFCNLGDDIKQAFTDLGNTLIDWITGEVDAIKCDVPSSGPGLSIGGPSDWPNIIQIAICSIGSENVEALKCELKKLLDCVKQMAATFIQCNPQTVISLALIRAAINFLQQLRIGWDAFVWGTVDVKLIFPQAEELIDRLMDFFCPTGFPGVNDAISLYLNAEITEKHLICILALRGQNYNIWNKVVHNRRSKLTAAQTIELNYRQGNQLQDFHDDLRVRGWIDQSDREDLLALYDRLPDPTAVIGMVQRGVTDDQHIQKYDLDNGFDIDFWNDFEGLSRAAGVTREVARRRYVGAWTIPSTSELADMMFRLRPGRVPGNLVFDLGDFSNWIDNSGIPPYFRDRISAITTKLPGFRQLSNILLTGNTDDKSLLENYKDLGYSNATAAQLASTQVTLAKRQTASQVHGFTPARLSQLYGAGLASDAAVDNAMQNLGYTQDAADQLKAVAPLTYQLRIVTRAIGNSISKTITAIEQSYQEGVVDSTTALGALTSLGFPPSLAEASLQAIDLAHRTQALRQAKGLLRKAVLRGELSVANAASELVTLGYTSERATEWAQLTGFELEVSQKHIPAGKIVDLASKGLLTMEVARQRLLNLGYAEPDTMLLVAEAEYKYLEAEAKSLSAADKAAAKQSKAVEAGIQKSQAQQARLQRELCRLVPVSRLQTWYADRIIGDDYFLARLTTCGYTPDAIQGYWEEAKLKREKADAKTKNGTLPAVPGPIP